MENEGDAERKQARVSGDGDGDGWSQGQGQQGQENGEELLLLLPVLPMNGVESSAPDAEGVDVDVDVVVGEEDPLVYGLSSFCRLLFDFDFSFPGAFFMSCSMDLHFSVDGKAMPFSQVGEEHHDLMTADEYATYFEIFQQRSV